MSFKKSTLVTKTNDDKDEKPSQHKHWTLNEENIIFKKIQERKIESPELHQECGLASRGGLRLLCFQTHRWLSGGRIEVGKYFGILWDFLGYSKKIEKFARKPHRRPSLGERYRRLHQWAPKRRGCHLLFFLDEGDHCLSFKFGFTNFERALQDVRVARFW